MSGADPTEVFGAASAPIGRGSWTVVGVVAFALFMDYLIYGLLIPLAPYSPAIGGGEQLGLLYGGYAAGVLVATPLFGFLVDRIGHRWPMIYGVILSALTVALFALAPIFYLLLLGRLLQGAAAAASWTAGLALIAVHYPKKRVEMMGFALMGSTAGSLLGPIIGGSLYEVGGYMLPFMVTGVLVAIDAGVRFFLLPRDRGSAVASPEVRALLLDRSVLIAAAAVAVAAFGWGIIEPLLPAHLRQSGASPTAVGAIFTVSSIAYGLSAPVVSRVADRLPVRSVITGGTVAMAAALPLLSLSDGAAAATAAFCLVSVCYAFMLNPTSAELGNAVDRRGMSCYGAVYAMYNIAYAVGQLASSAFASAAAAWLSFLQILLSVSGAMVVFAMLLVLKKAPASEVSSTIVRPRERSGNQV